MSTATDCRTDQGFQALVLRNESIELAAVPELGAKVISLVNLRSGRQWMYHPPGGPRLFCNRLGDDFAAGTLVGWDECLPTIAPCAWEGRQLPDHGEVWSAAWEVDAAAWERGVLSTSVRLAVSPLLFRRTIELWGGEIRLAYALTNQSPQPQSFLWAMHPLLAIEPGDRLELPAEVRGQLAGQSWPDSLELEGRTPACVKAFAGPLREGRAAVVNLRTGDRLAWEWDTAENDTLGLWLTRGGWNGHHHLALEPTNGSPDALAAAAGANRCGRLGPHATESWTVRLRLETS